MRICPQLILWSYLALPVLCILLSPTLILGIAKAQQQRAKLMADALTARTRATVALNQMRFQNQLSTRNGREAEIEQPMNSESMENPIMRMDRDHSAQRRLSAPFFAGRNIYDDIVGEPKKKYKWRPKKGQIFYRSDDETTSAENQLERHHRKNKKFNKKYQPQGNYYDSYYRNDEMLKSAGPSNVEFETILMEPVPQPHPLPLTDIEDSPKLESRKAGLFDDYDQDYYHADVSKKGSKKGNFNLDPMSYYQKAVDDFNKFNKRLSKTAKELTRPLYTPQYEVPHIPYQLPAQPHVEDISYEVDEYRTSGDENPLTPRHFHHHSHRFGGKHGGFQSGFVPVYEDHLGFDDFSGGHFEHSGGFSEASANAQAQSLGGFSNFPVHHPIELRPTSAQASAAANSQNFQTGQFGHSGFDGINHGGFRQLSNNNNAQAAANAQALNNRGQGFGQFSNNAQAAANSQNFQNGQFGQGFNQAAAEAQAHVAQNSAPVFPGSISNHLGGLNGFRGGSYQGAGGMSQAAAAAKAQSEANGFFGQSNAQSLAQAGSLNVQPQFLNSGASAAANSQAIASGNGQAVSVANAAADAGTQFLGPSNIVNTRGRNAKPEEPVVGATGPFTMPHMEDIHASDVLNQMETVIRPGRSQSNPDILEGLNLASGIVNSAIGLANQPENQLSDGTLKSTLKTETFDKEENAPEDKTNLDGFQSITDIVNESLKFGANKRVINKRSVMDEDMPDFVGAPVMEKQFETDDLINQQKFQNQFVRNYNKDLTELMNAEEKETNKMSTEKSVLSGFEQKQKFDRPTQQFQAEPINSGVFEQNPQTFSGNYYKQIPTEKPESKKHDEIFDGTTRSFDGILPVQVPRYFQLGELSKMHQQSQALPGMLRFSEIQNPKSPHSEIVQMPPRIFDEELNMERKQPFEEQVDTLPSRSGFNQLNSAQEVPQIGNMQQPQTFFTTSEPQILNNGETQSEKVEYELIRPSSTTGTPESVESSSIQPQTTIGPQMDKVEEVAPQETVEQEQSSIKTSESTESTFITEKATSMVENNSHSDESTESNKSDESDEKRKNDLYTKVPSLPVLVGAFNNLEKEMGTLSDKDQKKLITHLEVLFNGKPELKSSEEDEEIVSNIFQVYGTAKSPENRRNVRSDDFDVILGAHKEKIENIQKNATDDDDLLMISFIGNGLIKDLEDRRNQALATTVDKVSKRSVVELNRNLMNKLIRDPKTKINVPKTFDNVGAAVRYALENPNAPIHHITNMLGNTKNVIMSAARVPPNNLLIPSQYEIAKLENPPRVGAINWDMLKGHTDPTQTFDDGIKGAFEKLQGILQKSVESGKDVVNHANEAASDAKNAVYATKNSVPQLVVPHKLPIIGARSSFGELHKPVLVAPNLIETETNLVGSQHYPEDFVAMSKFFDDVGLTKPNAENVDLKGFVLDVPNNLLKQQKTDVEETSNLRDYIYKMRKEMKEVLTSQLKDRQNKRMEKLARYGYPKKASRMSKFLKRYREGEDRPDYNKILDENEHVTLPPEILNMFTEISPKVQKVPPTTSEQTTTDPIVGLHLMPELMKPFMGQPTRDFEDNFLRENGNEVESRANKEVASVVYPINKNISIPMKEGLKLDSLLPYSPLVKPYSANNSNERASLTDQPQRGHHLQRDDFTSMLGTVNPLMFEKKFNESMKVITKEIPLSVQDPIVGSSQNQVPQERRPLMNSDVYVTPFMGNRQHEKEFLHQYNEQLPEEAEHPPKDEVVYPVKSLIFDEETDYSNN